MILTIILLIKNTSRNQERHLDTLHNFVTRATNELIWLNEKEEEEVAYDWSERNTNITRKRDYHAVSAAPVAERYKCLSGLSFPNVFISIRNWWENLIKRKKLLSPFKR